MPDRYVALDFPTPDALPKVYEPGVKARFVFQIDNQTDRGLNQPWTVEVVGPGGARFVIDKGRAHLAKGAVATVTVVPVAPVHVVPALVRVSAPGAQVVPIEFHVKYLGTPRRATPRARP
jgi:hypothetical protein